MLAGVREFPVRVKCASLAWHTLKAALDRERRVDDRPNEAAADDPAAGRRAADAGDRDRRPASRIRRDRGAQAGDPRRDPRRCSIPEIPVNIWELGLIYDVFVDADGVAGIRMTLTAPGCPAAQSLPVEVEREGQGGARRDRREGRLVWEPPWTKDRMSDAAKLQLGMW